MHKLGVIAVAATCVAAGSALTVGSALSDDRIHVTPPIFRGEVHRAQHMPKAMELTTTPHPVGSTDRAPRPSATLKRPGVEDVAFAR